MAMAKAAGFIIPKENIRMAVISAATSAMVTIITVYALTRVAAVENYSAVQGNQRLSPRLGYQSPETSGEKSGDLIPVGTIVASLLDPVEFSQLSGNRGDFDTRTEKWIPADGREVPGSKYALLMKTAQLPDLRGMFLRGLNKYGNHVARSDGREDPDGVDRVVGSYQSDQVREHNHKNNKFQFLTEISGVDTVHEKTDTSAGEISIRSGGEILPFGGKETRPKNVGIYWYVRIN